MWGIHPNIYTIPNPNPKSNLNSIPKPNPNPIRKHCYTCDLSPN